METRNWVPMRWKAGPLDIEIEKSREGFAAQDADVLAAWSKPETLERLQGMPFNCIVVNWSQGSALDEEQRRAILPLVAAAQKQGLAVLGWVGGEGDLRPDLQSAKAAGLSGLATGRKDAPEDPYVLRFAPRGVGSGRKAFLGDGGAVWPGMTNPMMMGEADAQTGPTNSPWIDSNAWYVRLARSVLAPEVMWLGFEPPTGKRPIFSQAYVQAIADSEIYGARWVVALDARLRKGVLSGDAAARDGWRNIGRTLAFFRQHEAWSQFSPAGQIGVVSDFAGPNEFLGFELLNLLARNNGLYQVIERSKIASTALGDLDAVLWADDTEPDADVAKKLYAFAEGGGLLITPPGWQLRGIPVEDHWAPRFRVLRLGKGRLAVSNEAYADPQEVVEDAQLLVSHSRARVRMFNPGIGLSHYATSENARTGVLHWIKFPSPYGNQPTSVWFKKPWTAGQVYSVAKDEVVPAKRIVTDTGVEFHIPATTAYNILEVSE